ncbi:MAG TPA: hypothetical protein VF008_08715 [Niastella sp.]
MKRLLPLAFLLISFTSIAQSGSIDPSFGINGKIVENFGFAYFRVSCGAVQNDGKIIIGGSAENGTNGFNNIDFFLTRFNADGTIDNSFGNNGIVYSDISNKNQDYLEKLVILPNGKILAIGNSTFFLNDWVLRKSLALFTANGQLDAGFNGTGTIYSHTLLPGVIIDAVAQADGKILIAASNTTSGSLAKHMKFYWLNQDGTVDNKKLELQRFATANDYTVNSVGVLPDGKILTAGFEYNKAFLARHKANGNLDSTFGTDGRITQGPNYLGGAYLTLNADSTRFYTLLGAHGSLYSYGPVWIQKMLLDGTPDASFGNNGVVALPADSSRMVYLETLKYMIQPNDRIVMGGVTTNGLGINQFSALRLLPNGSVDNSFGSDGIIPGAAGGTRHETALVLTQLNGKSIIAGYELQDGKYKVALTRVNGDGSADNSFNQGGIASVSVGSGTLHTDCGQDIKVLPDGNMLASFFSMNGIFGSVGLVKYKADGSRDQSFGTNGLVYCDISTHPYPDFASFYSPSGGNAPIGTDAQGNIYILGPSYNTAKRKHGLTVLKFTPTGKRDSSFADYGRKNFYLPDLESNVPIGMAIQADGKPVIAVVTSYSTSAPDTNYITLLRLNTDGSPDLLFGVNGQVRENQFTEELDSRNQTSRLIIQPDGKILLCGEAKIPAYVRFAIRRYNANGSVDQQFNNGVMVVTDVIPNKVNIATAIALQPDGKILVAGTSNPGSAVMVRYTAEGFKDPTFGEEGIKKDILGVGNVSNILVQPDGKILIAGDVFDEDAATDQSFIKLARLRADGYADSAFGNNGTTSIVTSGVMQDITGAMAMTQDGRILVCGATTAGWDDAYGRQICNFVIYGFKNTIVDCSTIKANAGRDTAICSGESVVVGAPAVPGYAYRWGHGPAISSTTIAQPTVQTYYNTEYILTVVDAAGCAHADSVFVKVNLLPDIPTTNPAGSFTFCQEYFGGLIFSTSATGSLQWLKNGVIIPGATDATYRAETTGQYSVQVKDTNTCAATSRFSILTVNPSPVTPLVSTSGPLTFCQGGSVQLSTPATTGSLQWFNYGFAIAGANSNTYQATASGQYTVRVTDNNTCYATASKTTVTVNQVPATPSVYAGGPLTFCQGGTVQLLTTATGSLQWLNNGAVIAGANSNTYQATASGQYSVQVTDTNSCSATASAIGVTVNQPPVPVITQNGHVLQSSVSTGNQWYRNDTAIQSATGATYNANTPGNYTVKVTLNGCPAAVSNVITIVTTGINSPELDRRIVIAPNPIIDDLNIQYSGNVGRFIITVQDIYGVQIYGPGNFTTNFRLDMRNYPAGVYAVRILNTLNGEQIHRLIMKP